MKRWCCDVLSMFVLSKWQRVALPTRWRASVRALSYCDYTFLDHTTNISRKVRTPRCVSALRERQSMLKIVTWTKQTWTVKTSHHHHGTYVPTFGLSVFPVSGWWSISGAAGRGRDISYFWTFYLDCVAAREIMIMGLAQEIWFNFHKLGNICTVRTVCSSRM